MPIWLVTAGVLFAQENKTPPLWQLEPFDRIELADGSVHDIDPVRIPDKYTFKAAVENPVITGGPKPENEIIVRENEYVGILGLPSPDKLKGEIRGGLFRVRRRADGLDYYVAGRSIRRIEYFEDLLLQEANKLIRAGKLEDAIPFIQTCADRSAQWKGLLETRLNFHLREADMLVLRTKWDRAFDATTKALRIAEANPQLTPQPGGQPQQIREKLDQIVRGWFNVAMVVKDYEQGRRIAARLEQEYPSSPMLPRIRSEYADRVQQLLREVIEHRQAGRMVQAFDVLVQTLEVDPASPAARQQTEDFYNVHPVLRVAVAHTARFDRGPGDWSPADWRSADLVHLPLLQLTGNEDGAPFISPIIEDLTQSNINKRASLIVHDSMVWPDQKPVTAIDVLRLLVHSCRPESPLYHPGLSRIVRNLQPDYPNGLHIEFQRPQFRPAAWLQMHMIRTSGSEQNNRFSTAEGLGPYRLVESTAQRNVFVANPLFHIKDRPVIKEVIETRVGTSAERLRALEKREADLVPFVPPRQLAKAKAIPGARVVRLGRPTVHVLQFDYRRELLRDRTLRRAIDYAIDRNAILKAVGVTPDEHNRVITAALPYGSFGYNEKVEAREHNPLLAKAIILGLRKKHGSLPTLTLTHTGNETTLAACQLIAQSLREAGLSIIVTDRYDERLRSAQSDLRFESYVVKEPLYHLITLLTRENPTLLEQTSPWLRQQLVELQNVPHFTAANTLLPALHRTLHEDVAILPLWQWFDHFAVSDAVTNLPAEPTSVYDGVSEWSVTPTFGPAIWQSEPSGAAPAEGQPAGQVSTP